MQYKVLEYLFLISFDYSITFSIYFIISEYFVAGGIIIASYFSM